MSIELVADQLHLMLEHVLLISNNQTCITSVRVDVI